ncbi:glycosyltransferase family 8 protein [Oenococcus sp. UCMA 17063]|nr:glycosyltransferase family 8 protein [Oenococcus sp. UCMA 17063]
MLNSYTIFYSVDDNYVDPLTVSLHSLVANSNPSKKYFVIILTENLTQDHKTQLLAEAAPNVTIVFESMLTRFKAQITDKNNKLRADYFTYTIYFRLFIAKLFPTLNRAVYLDADTVVATDISRLFEVNLHGSLLGAVIDPFMAANPTTSKYTNKAVGVDVHRYCNSGVLLMDLDKLRQANFSERFLYLLNQYHFHSLAPDQDYINAIARDRLRYLDESWNVQGKRPKITTPKIIHYNLFDKPWHYKNVPNGDYFWHYANELPAVSSKLHQTRADFGPEQVANDLKHKNELMRLAAVTGNEKVTFASVAISGGQVQL